MMREPLMVIVGGGTVLVQAVIQLFNAFATVHALTAAQQSAIMTVAGIVLPLVARSFVTPVASAAPSIDLSKVGKP